PRGGPRPAASGARPSRGPAVRRASRAVPGNRIPADGAGGSLARVAPRVGGVALGPAHRRDTGARDRGVGGVAARRAARAGPWVRHRTRTTTRGVVLRWLACAAGPDLTPARAARL